MVEVFLRLGASLAGVRIFCQSHVHSLLLLVGGSALRLKHLVEAVSCPGKPRGCWSRHSLPRPGTLSEMLDSKLSWNERLWRISARALTDRSESFSHGRVSALALHEIHAGLDCFAPEKADRGVPRQRPASQCQASSRYPTLSPRSSFPKSTCPSVSARVFPNPTHSSLPLSLPLLFNWHPCFVASIH